jgi:universal stress protein E
MKPLRRILFAVKNPDSQAPAMLEKVARIAKSLKASVELYHAISSPVLPDAQPLRAQTLEGVEREVVALREAQLEKLAGPMRRLGVAVNQRVEWDFPPHEAILRRARRMSADLVIAQCHAGARTRPWLLHLTDWELLRLSPLPVLLLKNSTPWNRPVVMAAVDPTHAKDKPAALDGMIAAHAARMADAARGSLRLMHANMPAPLDLAHFDPEFEGVPLSELYLRMQERARTVLARFAKKLRVSPSACHFVARDPASGIPQAARELDAGLVVMGAVSRSGLKRVFIGNTAERVLAALPCDVLVIKPTRTSSRIAGRTRAQKLAAALPEFSIPA